MNKNFIERIKARVTKQQQLPEKVSNKILTDFNGKVPKRRYDIYLKKQNPRGQGVIHELVLLGNFVF